MTLDALVGDPARLADPLARIGDDVGSPRADVQASLLLEACAWVFLLPLVGALVEPGEAAVVLRYESWPDALVLSGSRFAASPGDPDADHPGAVAVDGVDGDVERGARAARAVLAGPRPLSGRPDYRIVATPEGPMRLHARQGCCLWRRTEAASHCLSCPCIRDPATSLSAGTDRR